MNRIMGVDRLAVTTINKIKERLQELMEPDAGEEIEDLAFFISWDLQNNIPKLMVDVTGITIHAVWIA
jgi:hypothetical protein